MNAKEALDNIIKVWNNKESLTGERIKVETWHNIIINELEAKVDEKNKDMNDEQMRVGLMAQSLAMNEFLSAFSKHMLTSVSQFANSMFDIMTDEQKKRLVEIAVMAVELDHAERFEKYEKGKDNGCSDK